MTEAAPPLPALLSEFFHTGGVTVVTYRAPAGGIGSRPEAAFSTRIQVTGDIVVRASEKALGDPSLWEDHRREIEVRLRPLGILHRVFQLGPVLVRWISPAVAWGSAGSNLEAFLTPHFWGILAGGLLASHFLPVIFLEAVKGSIRPGAISYAKAVAESLRCALEEEGHHL